ncbi:MAG: hypothetical protein ABSE27_04635 [Acidobacteriaceae bacterium]|jgi:hypothetical protein
MSNPEKIKLLIREIAGRKHNVTLAEIERVMNQLQDHCTVSSVENDHQRMYAIDGVRFGVCTHRSGGKQLKAIYVKEFLRAMSETGWYEN